jgi:hypothetical protein
MAKKRSWGELSGKERGAVAGIVAVALPVIVAAQRDLGRREDEEVRGPKAVWRVACLKGAGAIVYFAVGRRRG